MAETVGSTSSTEPSASEREPAGAPDGVALGRVVGAHGLSGELRVRARGDDLENLLRVPSVRLARGNGDREPDDCTVEGMGLGRARRYEVESARPGRAGECRLALRGVTSREAAEALRGALVLARSGDLPKLGPGEFYAYELVGCEVVRVDGGRVGTVQSVLETGGRDVLVIRGAGGREQLVPAVEPLLQRVDLAARRILIDAPPGLLDGDLPAPSADRNRERD